MFPNVFFQIVELYNTILRVTSFLKLEENRLFYVPIRIARRRLHSVIVKNVPLEVFKAN